MNTYRIHRACTDSDRTSAYRLRYELYVEDQGLFHEIADHLSAGRLVQVATRTPPVPVQMACLYTHRRHQDPKTRLFMDFMVERIARAVKGAQSRIALV